MAIGNTGRILGRSELLGAVLVQSETLAVGKDLPLLCLQNKVNFH